MLAEDTGKQFKMAKQACAFCLNWNLYLAVDLDGWTVHG